MQSVKGYKGGVGGIMFIYLFIHMFYWIYFFQPLPVCRSTSTVGFPLESKISRATIFTIDIL